MYTVAYRRPVQKTCLPGQESAQTQVRQTLKHTPPANIKVEDQGWTLQISVPGFQKSEIKTEVMDNKLVIEGKRDSADVRYTRKEWKNNDFSTSFRLPKEANAEGISATLAHGILNIDIPKKEKTVSKIEIL